MSTTSVSRSQQQIRLPSVVQRTPQKQDFTYTFQKVAPLLFVFLLSLSIYTKYKMATVHIANNEQLQVFTTPPWAHVTPKTPYVDTDLGEQKWAELKQTLAPTKDRIEETWEDIVDVGQGTWEEWKEYGQDKWDSIKGTGQKINKAASDLKEQGQEVFEQGKAKVEKVVPELTEQGQDIFEQGKKMLKKGKMIVEEKLAEASEVGKEKLAEATQKATEVGMDTKEWVAGKVSEMPSIQQTASIAKERMERAADQAGATISEKVDTVIESMKEVLPSVYPTIAQMASDKIEQLMEMGAVYQSPAPFNAQCPVIRSDMCPVSNRSFTPMPW